MFLPVMVVIIFLVTLALASSFLFIFVQAPLARRKMVTRLAALQEVAVRTEDVPDVLRREMLSDVPVLHRILATLPGVPNFKLFLEQAAIKMQIGTFLLISIGLTLFVFTGMFVFRFPVVLCVVAALLAGAAPFIIAAAKRQQRFNRFEEQFPEAMDLLGRAVRAGHAFTTGFELIGKELPNPVGEEFRIAFQQQSIGISLKDALGNLAVRMPLPDVLVFVSSLQIQRESGGNLGEILDTMSQIVRERFKLRRQVRIFTAEGRLSMYMLSCIPFVALLGLWFFQPLYLKPMFSDPRGQMALAVGAILQVIGYFVISRIIKIKI